MFYSIVTNGFALATHILLISVDPNGDISLTVFKLMEYAHTFNSLVVVVAASIGFLQLSSKCPSRRLNFTFIDIIILIGMAGSLTFSMIGFLACVEGITSDRSSCYKCFSQMLALFYQTVFLLRLRNDPKQRSATLGCISILMGIYNLNIWFIHYFHRLTPNW